MSFKVQTLASNCPLPNSDIFLSPWNASSKQEARAIALAHDDLISQGLCTVCQCSSGATAALASQPDSALLHTGQNLFHGHHTSIRTPWINKSNFKLYYCVAWVWIYLKTSDVVLESRGCGTRWEFLAGRSSSVCATEMWWCSEAWWKNKDSYLPSLIKHGAEKGQAQVC